MVAAKVLTTKLVAPIEKLAQNIGECTEMQTYEELTPFMSMIRKQHEDIMKMPKCGRNSVPMCPMN